MIWTNERCFDISDTNDIQHKQQTVSNVLQQLRTTKILRLLSLQYSTHKIAPHKTIQCRKYSFYQKFLTNKIDMKNEYTVRKGSMYFLICMLKICTIQIFCKMAWFFVEVEFRLLKKRLAWLFEIFIISKFDFSEWR